MKCKVCEFEYSGYQCPHCGFVTLNMVPGTPQYIVDTYQQELAKAKADWERAKASHSEQREEEKEVMSDDKYSLSWGTNHPGHLVYLIDLSGSMERDGKFEMVKEVIQEVSNFLVGMSKQIVRENGQTKQSIKDRFTVKILAYNSKMIKLFEGSVIDLNKKLKEAKEAKKQNLTKEDFPLLSVFNPDAKPSSMTYTEMAFKAAKADILQWIALQTENKMPIPAPIVIHITDGHPEEQNVDEPISMKNALDVAKEIKQINVPDGNVLLFNIHITGKSQTDTLRFPITEPSDPRLKFLYDASSPLSNTFCERAQSIGLEAKPGCRFMVSNESEKDLLARLIKFGSSLSSYGIGNPPPKYD